MFERFTEKARQVVKLAQETAAEHRRPVDIPCLFAGLIYEGTSDAYRHLAGLLPPDLTDTGDAYLRSIVDDALGVPPLSDKTAGPGQWSNDARRVLELALREALQLGHNWIGPEHILLGIIRHGQSVVADLLVDHVAGWVTIRTKVTDVLCNRVPAPPPAARGTVDVDRVRGAADGRVWRVRNDRGQVLDLTAAEMGALVGTVVQLCSPQAPTD